MKYDESKTGMTRISYGHGSDIVSGRVFRVELADGAALSKRRV